MRRTLLTPAVSPPCGPIFLSWVVLFAPGLLSLSAVVRFDHYALNKAADALAQSGTAFSSDDDSDLIKKCRAFQSQTHGKYFWPKSTAFRIANSSGCGFTQYSFAFVQKKPMSWSRLIWRRRRHYAARALRLYLRAQRFWVRGLEVKDPHFGEDLLSDPKRTVLRANKKEVPLLYWTAAAWGSVISLSKDNPKMVGQIPAMEALIDRALELDESYAKGSIHTFLITYEMSRARHQGILPSRARKHF